MKTRSDRIVPVTNQIPRLAPATEMRIEAPQYMKTSLTILKSIIAVIGALAITSAFGQSSYVWTNQNPALLNTPAGGDMNFGTNWLRLSTGAGGVDPGGVPRPDFQDGVTWGDEMQFAGL